MTPEIREEIERIRLIHPEAAEWLDEHEERIDAECCELENFFTWKKTTQGDGYWRCIYDELIKLKKGEPYKVLNGRKKGVKMAEEKKIETETDWKFMLPSAAPSAAPFRQELAFHNAFFGIDYGFKQQPKEKEMNKIVIEMYPKDTVGADVVDRYFGDKINPFSRVLLIGHEKDLLKKAQELEEAAKAAE